MIYDNRRSLSQPRFGDKRTLLAARRVVPLTVIRRRIGIRHGVLFVGAVSISAILGAAVSILTIYIQRAVIETPDSRSSAAQSIDQNPVAVAVPDQEIQWTAGSGDIQAAGELAGQTSVSLSTNRHESPGIGRSKSNATPIVLAPQAEMVANPAQAPNPPADHWEERRLRRVMPGSEGQRPNRNDGDVLRIPEIFEGRRP